MERQGFGPPNQPPEYRLPKGMHDAFSGLVRKKYDDVRTGRFISIDRPIGGGFIKVNLHFRQPSGASDEYSLAFYPNDTVRIISAEQLEHGKIRQIEQPSLEYLFGEILNAYRLDRGRSGLKR
jgi:hypothetical protein